MPPQTESKELLCPSNGIKLSANLALKGLLGKDKDSDKGKDRDREKTETETETMTNTKTNRQRAFILL